MTKTVAILKKELKTYFVSPLAYCLIAFFLLLTGYFFTAIVFNVKDASMHMRLVFANMGIILLLITPLFTMRTLADEQKTGTDELLMTAPLTNINIVLGKYFAVIVLFLVLMLITLEYPIILLKFGKPDLGPIYTGYIGILLMGGAFISIGLFTSSLTSSQMIAAVASFAILLILYIIDWASGIVASPMLQQVLSAISITKHLEGFEKGILDSVDVFYYLGITFIFLFLTVRVLDTRRW